MGLGSDPLAVYRALTRGRIPQERISPEQFWNRYGAALDRQSARGIPDAKIAEYIKKYWGVQPPTPYEDPTLYSMLLEMSDSIEAAWRTTTFPPPPRLLFGSLPSGIINAETIPVQDKEYIIAFQRGLFDFAHQLSKVAASVFPPIDLRRGWFSKDFDIAAATKANPEVLNQFNRILRAYVVDGDSRSIAWYPVDDAHRPAAGILLRSLELFVLGHEYGHVLVKSEAGLGPPPPNSRLREAWDREYGADRVGLSLMNAVTRDLPLTFWGPVQFFSGMEAFRRALSILRTGEVDPGTSGDHPPPLVRAQNLRAVVRESMPGAEAEKAIHLADQLDAFWGRLWQMSEERWIAMHKQKVKPSLIW
jgi:hypothetical protein